MKRKGKGRRIIWLTASVMAALALCGGVGYYVRRGSAEPVSVYSFSDIGMTEYWGDNKESDGMVTADRVQTVYLSETQRIKQVMVQQGDTVKKGDVLVRFDTTLSELELERKRLDVEKLKLKMEQAQERLKEINRMVPMAIPAPRPNIDVPGGDDGVPLSGKFQIISPDSYDGSRPEQPIVCWIGRNTLVDDGLFASLHDTARRLQALKPAAPASGGNPDGTTAAADTSPATPTATPTAGPTQPEPTGEPTLPPETTPVPPETTPVPPETTPAPPETTPSGPEETPKPVEVREFYVIFKMTGQDMSKGGTQTWQGLWITADNGSYGFRLFDASAVADPSLEEPSIPDIDWGGSMNSGYTAKQIQQMRVEQEKEIRELEFSIKMAEAEYKIMQTEVADGEVVARFDGTVVSLLPEAEAKAQTQPFIKVSGGGGFYIQGAVSELDREGLKPGQTVTVNDWNTGATLTATVNSVSDYPVSGAQGYRGMGNPNASYYPFTVFIDGSENLMEGSYVGITYAAGQGQSGIYLQNAFLRTEQGRSYVFVAGAEGRLEKRYVTTGKTLWGESTEILSGLDAADRLAFPYGKNVTEGAPTQEGSIADLYSAY